MKAADSEVKILRGRAAVFRHLDGEQPEAGQVWILWAIAGTGEAQLEVPVRRKQVRLVQVDGSESISSAPGALGQEAIDQAANGRFFPPQAIALEGAFAGDAHALDGADAAEVLDEGAVGEAGGEAAEIVTVQDGCPLNTPNTRKSLVKTATSREAVSRVSRVSRARTVPSMVGRTWGSGSSKGMTMAVGLALDYNLAYRCQARIGRKRCKQPIRSRFKRSVRRANSLGSM
jgi:hypothetical protein